MFKKYILTAIVVILVLAGGGYLVWRDLQGQYKEGGHEAATNTPKTASSTPNVTITPVPVGKHPIPALPFPPEIKASLSAESKVLAISALKEIVAQLRRDPTQEGFWIDYGLQMNFIGDYQQARDAWEYAAYLRPDDFIPPHNLGDLYTYSLNDYAKAEESYRHSISLDPSQLMVYQKLHELYRYKIKDNIKARSILEEGIVKNPKTSDWLKKLLAEFASSTGQ